MTTIITNPAVRGSAPDFGRLASEIAGEVVRPGDAGYEVARGLHDISYDRWPATIVRASNGEDVARTIRFAREHDIPLAVRSGGHSLAGLSSIDDAIVVDLGSLKGISIDAATRTARVQPGVTSGELAPAAHLHGLALTTGDTSTVAIGGLTLGGGIGFMTRKYGLTIDSLLSAEVVTADGRVVHASAQENPDLFWAVRGGGGNFGIVTEFTFRLAPVRDILGGMIFVPATHEAIRGYLDCTPDAPDDLTTIGFVMAAPPAPFIPADRVGELVLGIAVCWTGALEEGRAAIAPLYALGTPVADVVDVMPYPALYDFTAEGAAPHAADIRSMFAPALSDDAIDAILDAMRNATSPISMVQLRGLGGMLARVDAAATAFPHRDARVMASVIACWKDADEDATPHRLWTRSLFETLRPEGDGAYVNFIGNGEGAARVREAYPNGTYARLASVKRTWDPENFFRGNQNVRPA